MRGTPYLLAWRHTVSDCASTPILPSNTVTAPSSTRSERSTSAVKSMCPGVSMILILWSFQKQVTAAEVMVIPRSFSCAIQSVVAPSPSPLTTPILCVKPVRYKIPSVVVVLPASIWAMIPIFLKFCNGTFAAICLSFVKNSYCSRFSGAILTHQKTTLELYYSR